MNIIYGYLFETHKREYLKEMSVIFSDIRNFTTISEGLPAAELVDMLNTFFTPMTEIIFKHRGTIDNYVGDLIMAFWGAPLRDRYHARHAIQSALEMQAKVKEMQPMLENWDGIYVHLSK